MSNKFVRRNMAEILPIRRSTLSINRSIQANLSNYHNNSMFELSKDNIEQINIGLKGLCTCTVQQRSFMFVYLISRRHIH